MTVIKYTKSSLRDQQSKLKQLQKYLPTLKLKKALLQIEVNNAKQQLSEAENAFQTSLEMAREYGCLLQEKLGIDIRDFIQIDELVVSKENIAGIEVPHFKYLKFKTINYSLYETPPWIDTVILKLQALVSSKIKISVELERMQVFQNELKTVSIRVNLFEKILIPRTEECIKKIRVFLGDQLLAGIGQIKIAKSKIEERKFLKLKSKLSKFELLEELGA